MSALPEPAPAEVPAEQPADTGVVQTGPARWPVAVALLNLTGLGLGYWYLDRRRLAVWSVVVTAGLLVVAFATDAAQRPWLWRGIAAGWVVLLALDGWRLARRHPGARTAARRRPALVAAAVIAALLGGYALYGVVGNRVLASGQAAQAAGDCGKATARFDLVTGPFELTLSPAVAAAERSREYCTQFEAAAARHDRGEYEAAIAGYRQFLSDTPANPLDGPAQDQIQRAHLDWARSARSAGDYPKAISVYQRLLGQQGNGVSAGQARGELAQTYLDHAQALRAKFDPAGGSQLVFDVRTAMENYLKVMAEFGDTDAADAIPNAIQETFQAAIRPFTDGKFCQAVPTLEYLADLPARAGDLVNVAKQDHVKAAFECGLLRYQSGTFREAADHFDTVATKYRDHALAPAAGSAYIAATIATHKPGITPPLPPPLSGDTPGTISLTFYNDSSLTSEVLLLGPTAHRIVVAGCTFCPEGYDNEADACTSETGRPSVHLRLRPGTYYLLHRDLDSRTNNSEVSTIPLRGTETYCLYRGPLTP